jgi:hypothetical protein
MVTASATPTYYSGVGATAQTVNNPFASAPTTSLTTALPPPTTPASPLEGFTDIRNSLGAPTQLVVPSIYELFASKQPQMITGLGESYFQAERDRRKNALREEFFGPTGVLNQRAYLESGQGRLGSGVGQRLLESTVTNPFTQRYTEIDNMVAQEQLQEQARVDQINTEISNSYNTFLGNLAASDSGNYLQAQIANNEINLQLDELAAKLSSDWASQLNDYELQSYESYLDLLAQQLQQDQWNQEFQLEQDKFAFDINQ